VPKERRSTTGEFFDSFTYPPVRWPPLSEYHC
jgi:hypothetical protein